jgi:membrane-bound serine protease (ClpP class)
MIRILSGDGFFPGLKLAWLLAAAISLCASLPAEESDEVEVEGIDSVAVEEEATAPMPAEEEAESADAAPSERTPTTASPASSDRKVAPRNTFIPERPFEAPEGNVEVYVVPIQGPIANPTLFILRRAFKEAIDRGIDVIVLDIDTPGGALGTTLEIMEAISRFPGTVIAFVNSEAISAGAYIAISADHIFFTPRGIMGAAEAVRGDGAEIPEGMQRKMDSYLSAKIEVFTEEFRYRGDVLRAMAFPEFELKIDDEVIKQPGQLLTVTATQAHRLFGDPAIPLLGNGIFEDIESLLNAVLGEDNYTLREFEVTWSEGLAQFMQIIAPGLIGLGLLLLFIEFKTPGFGVPGIVGISFLLTVFASNYVAGLAGNEEILVFILGVLLVLVEIFLLPGFIIFALVGIILILGSLIWAMADIWPDMEFSGLADAFFQPILNLSLGLVIGLIGALLLARYLPSSWVWDKLVLAASVGRPDSVIAHGATSSGASGGLPAIGALGVATTDLYPGGEVEIDGRRFQASSSLGQIESGESIEVIGYRSFGLLVQRRNS